MYGQKEYLTIKDNIIWLNDGEKPSNPAFKKLDPF
jgi:hypothetical protein